MLACEEAKASSRRPVVGTVVMSGISGSFATDRTRSTSVSRKARRRTGSRVSTGSCEGSMPSIVFATWVAGQKTIALTRTSEREDGAPW
jgi:hypothetical protein